MNRLLCLALLAPLAAPLLGGCGPTILEKRIIEKPDPALLRPRPTPEEERGDVPALRDIQPRLTLVPADHEAPQPPDDPRPLALRDAPPTAGPLPPPPTPPAPPAADGRDDRGDERRDDRRDETEDEAEAEEPEGDDGPRDRGGMRVNPR